VPILRNTATRSPYFHNGLADGIDVLVEFYDQRFAIGLTATEKRQLGMFVESL
jgi:cytochrome c peroxidase